MKLTISSDRISFAAMVRSYHPTEACVEGQGRVRVGEACLDTGCAVPAHRAISVKIFECADRSLRRETSLRPVLPATRQPNPAANRQQTRRDSKSAANPATQQPGNTRQNRKTRQPGSLTGQMICEDVRPPTRQFPATQQ